MAEKKDLLVAEVITRVTLHKAIEAIEQILSDASLTGFYLCRLDAERLEKSARIIREKLKEPR